MSIATVKTVTPPFWQDWLCVSCRAKALRSEESSIDCANCGKSYPLLSGIPAFVNDLEAHRAYIRQASLERPTWYFSVQRVAREYFRPEAATLVVVRP